MNIKGFFTSHIPLVVAVGVIAVWGETFVSSKVLLNEGLMPADIFTLRFLIAYVCMIGLSHKRMWADSFRDEIKLILAGAMGGALYFLAENMALKYSTASNVSIIVGTTPMVTALLLACFYREERINRLQIVGSAVAFVGLTLVVLNGQLILRLNPLGDALALGASFAWGFYSLIMKSLTSRYDSRFITRKVFAYGLIAIIPWLVFVNPLQTDASILFRPIVVGNILYLGLVASMLCYVAWNWVLPRLGIVFTTNIVYLQCIFTMLASYLVLHEHITPMAIMGTIILIAGMALMSKKELKP